MVGLVALVAGGGPSVAFRLAASMIALQVSIGALNDIIDAPRDAGLRQHKPIPAGSVSRRAAAAVVVLAAGVGLLSAVPSGLSLVALAAVGLVIGAAYDLWFKGTAWSWLPFAIGIPLLPVYGWLGAAGELSSRFILLLPLAVLAGAAVAIANARADIQADEAAGTRSIATELGADRAWLVNAVLLTVVLVVAVGSLVAGSPDPIWIGTAVVGAGTISVGVALGRRSGAGDQRLAWEIEAIGLGILAAAWLAGSAADQ